MTQWAGQTLGGPQEQRVSNDVIHSLCRVTEGFTLDPWLRGNGDVAAIGLENRMQRRRKRDTGVKEPKPGTGFHDTVVDTFIVIIF